MSLIAVLFVSNVALAEDLGHTEISAKVSEVVIDADIFVLAAGYTVDGVSMSNSDRIFVFPNDTVVITLNHAPFGSVFKAVVELDGETRVLTGNPITISDFPRDRVVSIPVRLSLTLPPSSPDDEPDYPDTPDVPDVPTEPDTPSDPNTPGSDEPGSDEPYRPILPPAGSVYNLAGFIPLGAGALLLFLVFFWRRKVYRILKSHAKKYGEKPEKEHLKEIADAIIKLVRDEGRYPEWRKNSDVAKRLSADIVSVLDEMNYPKAVPRGALVAEIIKAARGKINRHRL